MSYKSFYLQLLVHLVCRDSLGSPFVFQAQARKSVSIFFVPLCFLPCGEAKGFVNSPAPAQQPRLIAGDEGDM